MDWYIPPRCFSKVLIMSRVWTHHVPNSGICMNVICLIKTVKPFDMGDNHNNLLSEVINPFFCKLISLSTSQTGNPNRWTSHPCSCASSTSWQ